MNADQIEDYQMFLANRSNSELKIIRGHLQKQLELVEHELKLSNISIKEGFENETRTNG